MCLTCGCLFGGKGNKLRFKVEGYTKGNAREIKESLLGLPCVYNVHIHAHNGETTINYNPGKTPLTQLAAEFAQRSLTALL